MNFEFSYSEFFSGRFDTSGSMVPRLIPEILSKCAFCDGVGGGGGGGVGIGDSRSLIHQKSEEEKKNPATKICRERIKECEK